MLIFIKKTILYTSLLLLLVFLTDGCVSLPNEPEVTKLTLDIVVMYDSSYTKTYADSARVIIKEVYTQIPDTLISDKNGLVKFHNILPGIYDISTRQILTTKQYYELTGISRTRALNGTLNQYKIIRSTNSPIKIRFPK